MSCWDKRTALETSLLLALLVSLPFLIFMIVTYLSCGAGGRSLLRMFQPIKIINCERACKCFAHFEMSIPTPPVYGNTTLRHAPPFERDVDKLKMRSITDEDACSSQDANLAAVVKMLYVDDPYDTEYLCPAAVISPIYLTAGADCPITNATDLHARIGSPYWAKRGYLHAIKKLRKSGRILLMELAVPIQIDVHFARIGDLNHTTFSVYGSNRNMKHQEYLADDLSLVENRFCNMTNAKNGFCGASKTNVFFERLNDTHLLPMVGDDLIGVFHTVLRSPQRSFYGFRKILSFTSYIQIIMNSSLY